MNPVQQFPDISEKIRSKNRIVERNYRSANARRSLAYTEEDALVKYYEGEFRKWHIKFLFILSATIGVVALILLKSFWIYNLFNRR
jgi:hypothetical protein